MRKLKTVVAIMACSALVACQTQETKTESAESNLDIWPVIKSEVKADNKVEKKVETLLAEMTLEQKVAQMIQPEIRDVTVEDMRKYGFGSYLNGGGAFPNNNKHASPADWIQLAEDMYQASIDDSLDGSTIPTMWGTDAVHGHNNVIGATLFPHNIGLGAANNPELIEQIATITATEVMVTGIDWVFAPTVAAVRDDRWGRTYEGYSEHPDIIKAYSASIVRGLQGRANKDFLSDNRVISTVKHFIGDGGTLEGDDQGNNVASEQELFDIHAQGYVGGLSAGAQSVMASFNSWHGEKLHGHDYLLTKVLKDKMGFDGLVVGDWNGHGQVAGCDNTSCPQAIIAGVDIIMVPSDWKTLFENTVKQVQAGEIPMARIDDAVKRILRVKVRAGLFEKPSPANRLFSGKTELIGQESHRDVARQAVRESLVLLKNKNNLLPLNPKARVLVAGDGAHNIGKQSGGWSITWQGTNNTNADFPGGTSIYDGIKQQVESAGGTAVLNEKGQFQQKPDVAIVVFGEEPYAEGVGDIADLEYQKGVKSDLALLKHLKSQNIPVVAVFITGRPMWMNAELNASDAFVVAWLPGSEGQGVADVMFKTADNKTQYDFTGKLSFSWPQHPEQIVNLNDADYQPLFKYGYGLSYGDKDELSDNLDETYESDAKQALAVNIHTGSLQSPWQMKLFSGDAEQAVNANSHEVAGLTYRTIDKVVQEDAFKLVTSNAISSGVKFDTDSAFVLSGNSKPVLSLDVLLAGKTEGNVEVNLGCINSEVSSSCGSSYSLTEKLTQLPLNQWQTIDLDLTCESLTDVQVNQIRLLTRGKLDLSVANVKIGNKAGEVQSIPCS